MKYFIAIFACFLTYANFASVAKSWFDSSLQSQNDSLCFSNGTPDLNLSNRAVLVLSLACTAQWLWLFLVNTRLCTGTNGTLNLPSWKPSFGHQFLTHWDNHDNSQDMSDEDAQAQNCVSYLYHWGKDINTGFLKAIFTWILLATVSVHLAEISCEDRSQ